MMETAPRKKAKGETFIRAYLMGRRLWTRCLPEARRTAMGSKDRSLG